MLYESFFFVQVDIDIIIVFPLNSVSTKEIILGTQDGQLFEMAVDEKDKREKYVKFLFELEELPEAFMDLQVPYYRFTLYWFSWWWFLFSVQ